MRSAHFRGWRERLSLLVTVAAVGLALVGCYPTATEVPAAPTAVTTAAPQAGFWSKATPGAIRIMSYNVNMDSIFSNSDPRNALPRMGSRTDQFRRILAVVQPDIACLQEIGGGHDAADVATIFDEVLPLPGGAHWQAYKGYDNVIVSRFPLSMEADQTVPNSLITTGQAMALADLPDATYPTDLYLMDAHMKSGGSVTDIAKREHQGDALTAWIGDMKTPGGKADLPAKTPFVVLGDLNAYDTDPARQVNTLVTGDIINNDDFGADIQPDWDNSTLTDALPRHNSAGAETWTWRDDSQDFNPAALDRIIYADSVLEVRHSFVLDTVEMSDADLATTGLQRNDVMLTPQRGVYDHLPLVVDVTPVGR